MRGRCSQRKKATYKKKYNREMLDIEISDYQC